MRTAIIMSGLLGIGLTLGYELVTNGDFEAPLTTGWTQTVSGDYTSSSYYTIDRAMDYNPDPDYEAQSRKYLHEIASLSQIVPIPHIDINFSAQAKLWCKCEDNAYNYFAAAALILYYMNNDSQILGETRIYRGTTYCNWQNSSTIHLIRAADTSNWYNYSFIIRNELNNLPGINPAQVKRIKVALYAYSTHNC
ncbi:MAG: hypothetical protein ABIL05_00595 [candidate division WOR-3 bacterium]